MAYTQLTMSPATIEFARKLGAGGIHMGILGALPSAMLFMEFVAAIVANHLKYRRRLWLGVSVIQRLIHVPLAAGPFLFPEVSDAVWVWGLILVTAANHALLHFCTPLWMSWMGDYLPREGLSRFWGVRHLWMQWTAALSLFLGAMFLLNSGVEIRTAFAVLIGAGAVLGLADLAFFLKIEEPPVQPAPEPQLRTVFSAPFKNPDFRTFISHACFWNFAAMLGAPFISLYLLAHVGMDLYHVLMLWTCSWIGGAALSGRFGHWADEFGHRPLLILCTACKSVNMLALLLVPREPALAFCILVPVFMVDAALNAGIAIATNGFLLKNSPSVNRSMYIAAGTALAGMVGGLTSILAGAALSLMEGWTTEWRGLTLVGFHWLFAVSVLMRFAAVILARRIREPESRGVTHVMTQLVGVTPMRVLQFPLGLYRNINGRGERSAKVKPAGLPVPAAAVLEESREAVESG